ncbi:MAG: hypothetical protein M3Y87_06785 [Myxococcota bacterium]|nr:hypothetical protein [Myxococcota bacterium]
MRLENDGEEIIGVFCAEPYAFAVGVGKRSRLRVALNFFVLRERAMKVVMGDAQWFETEAELPGRSHGNPEDES